MRLYFLLFLLFLFLPKGISAQPATDTFGTSWIREGQTYLRLAVADDGLYRIASSSLADRGVPISEIPGRAYQLFRHGVEEPIWVSSETDPLGPNDFIEFAGRHPRNELDTLLLPDGISSLNPEISLFTDSTMYFLTWSGKGFSGIRYERPPKEQGELQEVVTILSTRVFRESFMQPTYHSYLQDSRIEAAEGFGSTHRHAHQWAQPLPGYMPKYGPVALNIRYATRSDIPTQVIFGYGGQKLANIRPDKAWKAREVTAMLLPPGDAISFFAQAEKGRITLAFAKIRYPRSVESLAREKQPLWVAGDSMLRMVVQHNGIWVHPDRRWRSVGDTIRLPASTDPWLFQPTSSIRWLQPTKAIRPISPPDKPADYYLVGPTPWLQSGGAGEALASYRASAAGGAYRVRTWSREDLAFWFGYGYEQHPLAYRRWSHWLSAQGRTNPMILLLGKTLTYVHQRQTGGPFSGPPTYGYPGSDQLLFQEESTASSPVVGRIAARTEQQLWHYLRKVKRYETLLRSEPGAAQHFWRKRVLHISGGRGSERARFAALLDQLEHTLTQNAYGAQVINAAKESDAPVDMSVSRKAIRAIDQGIGIKTFLGHGAVANTDIGLDDPALFGPTDKTGLFFSLGCSTGNLFTNQESVSERFVLARDRGALAYIATSGVASDYGQFAFTRLFYEALGGDCFACPLGNIMQKVRQNIGNDTSRIQQILNQQMAFHGDPALQLQLTNEADYALDSASVQVTRDQLAVSLDIKNVGRNQADTVPIQLLVISPSGKRNTFDTAVVIKGYLNLKWAIPFTNGLATGAHKLMATLDPDRTLLEPSRENNRLDQPLSFEVVPAGPQPLFPPDNWVVTDTVPALWASMADPFAKETVFQFELDTVADFSSPFRKKKTVVGGSAACWRLENLPIKKDTAATLFWRVYSPGDPPDNQAARSFTYHPGGLGTWQQTHSRSFSKNQLLSLTIDSTAWTLTNRPVGILAMSVSDAPVSNDRSRLFLDNDSVDKVPNGQASFTVYSFDKQDPDKWSRKIYAVAEPSERKKLVTDLSAIPVGTNILVLGYLRRGYSFDVASWSDLRPYLERQGATQLARLARTGQAPYAFAYRKGEQVLGEIPVPDTPATRANLLFDLPFPVQKGTMVSPRIGPARHWGAVSVVLADSIPGQAKATITLLANATSGDTLHWGTWPVRNRRIRIDLSELRAAQWPYLILLYQAEAPVPRLRAWTVNYEPTTETALADLSVPDTLWQGQPTTLTGKVLAFPPDRQGIPVTTSFRTERQGVIVSDTLAAPGHLTLPFPTNQRTGEVPLHILLEALHPNYPEWNSRNNRAHKSVFIGPDNTAPSLLVTIDNQVPVTDQLVHPEPHIRIHLADQNPYGLVSDPSLLDLNLTLPDGTVYRISPDHPWVHQQTVTGPGDTLVWEVTPQLHHPGRYKLKISGQDRFGNQTSSEVSFLVGQWQALLSLRPFPNPFSRRVRFAYTYRGLSPAADFRLVFVNSLGQIVRDIDAAEFGPLLPGVRVSNWSWDGKDETGKIVPAGLYWYRIVWNTDHPSGMEKKVPKTGGVLIKVD